MQALSQTIFYDKYSRVKEDGTRETWEEAVRRVVGCLRFLSDNRLPNDLYFQLGTAILNQEVLPSMRLFAGGVEAEPLRCYNCAAVAVDDLSVFPTILYLSMNGVGVGVSVEDEYIRKLPVVADKEPTHRGVFVVPDTTEGWCDAVDLCIRTFYEGDSISFDFSKIRPAGSPLKTKGGVASGPEPLSRMLKAISKIIEGARGRKLTSLEVHRIVCWLAEAAVCGGVRRSAILALFDEGDELMFNAKSAPNWYKKYPELVNANISVVTATPYKYIRRILETDYGEPGVFNRDAITPPLRRQPARWLVNPCGEVALRSKQFCNLSSAVLRPYHSFRRIEYNVRLATIIGVIQSLAIPASTRFSDWIQNIEEERLLGVNLLGLRDRWLTAQELRLLREVSVATATYYAKKLGIATPAAVTTIKPSGNSGLLVDASPGLSNRFSQYYLRRVRLNRLSPVAKTIEASGWPVIVEQRGDDTSTYVVEFPVQAPTKVQPLAAVQQIRDLLTVQRNWTEHQPSVTISYRRDEIDDILWLEEELNSVVGITFLANDHRYPLAPYEEISEETYRQRVAALPEIRWELLPQFETGTIDREVECSGGVCEI